MKHSHKARESLLKTSVLKFAILSGDNRDQFSQIAFTAFSKFTAPSHWKHTHTHMHTHAHTHTHTHTQARACILTLGQDPKTQFITQALRLKACDIAYRLHVVSRSKGECKQLKYVVCVSVSVFALWQELLCMLWVHIVEHVQIMIYLHEIYIKNTTYVWNKYRSISVKEKTLGFIIYIWQLLVMW